MTSDNVPLLELIATGDVALYNDDFGKAIECYEQALEIARDIGDRERVVACLVNLGIAYSYLGKVKKAIDYFEQALEIARDMGDRSGEYTSLVNLGIAYRAMGEVKKAINYYEQALEITRDIGDRSGESVCFGTLGVAYRYLGEVKKAIDYYEQALEITRDIGERRREGDHLGNLGDAYSYLGEVKKAIDYYEQALEIARDAGDRRGEGVWICSIGEINLILGNWNKSSKLFSEALEIFKIIGDPIKQAETLSYLGDLQIKSGDWENARINLNTAIQLYKKTSPNMAVDALVNISELDILEKSFDRASENLQSSLEIISRSGLKPTKTKIFNKLGKIKLMEYEINGNKENLSTAKEYIENALQLAIDLQMPFDQGISLRKLGKIHFKDNQKKESFVFLEKSLDIFRDINAKHELTKTYFEFAKILNESGDHTKSEEIVKICAFESIHNNFKELEIDAYMLLGNIVWKQDASQFGYYLDAFKAASVNPRIYVKTLFLLIRIMKKMDTVTTIDFATSLKSVNNEVHINNFFDALLLKIGGENYNTKELPKELVEELSAFDFVGKN